MMNELMHKEKRINISFRQCKSSYGNSSKSYTNFKYKSIYLRHYCHGLSLI